MSILYSPWTSQPQQAVGIDWGNPITRGLVHVYTPKNSGDFVNVGVTNAVTKNGVSSRFSSGASAYASSAAKVSSLPLTLFALTKQSITGTDHALINIGASTNNRHVLYWNIDRPAIFSNAGATNSQARPASAIPGAGEWKALTGVVAASNSRSIYVDGVLTATDTATVSPAALDSVHIGCTYVSGARSLYYSGDIAIGLVFARALSDAEIRSISQNPWQIFKPIPRRIFVPVATGGGTTAVTADHNASYTITGSVAADASAAYAIRAAVTADATASYTLRTAAQSDQAAAYAIRAAVASDLSGSYAIQTAGTVTAGLDAAYAVRSSVAGDISVGYQIAAAVQAEVATAYAVRAAVQKDLAAGYSVSDSVTNVASDIVCTYAINGVSPSYPTAESIADAVRTMLLANPALISDPVWTKALP